MWPSPRCCLLFAASGLKTGFQIGFLIFSFPFLIIDLWWRAYSVDGYDDDALAADHIPAFKIMLFVLIDGWSLVFGTGLQLFGMSPRTGISGGSGTMTPDSVLDIGQRALEVTTVLGGRGAGPALMVGLLVAMFPGCQQINEMTLVSYQNR